MNKTLLALLAILILLVACAPQPAPPAEPVVEVEKEEVEEKEITVPEPTPAPEPEPVPAPTPAPVPEPEAVTVQPPQKEPSSEIKDLLSKADQKVKSYSYLYADPLTEGRYLDTYNIKGTKIKIAMFPTDPYIIENYFDTIYLDTSDKSATGRCEEEKRCISHNTDNTEKVYEVSFDEYYRKTSYEWIKGVSYAEMVGPEVVESRSAVKIKIPEDDKTTYMWVSDTYGLPMKVVIEYDDGSKETYGFKDYVVNSLKDEDVVPKFT